ncbi:histidine kinase [Nonomuraea sp. NPDC000554]|uniref:sensor histidine kinase n=1 Tax=Nonomuraea sp. NPDC000554 TaxID=3154259 RepID=UPI00331EA25A
MISEPENLPPRLARAMMWATLGLLFLVRLVDGRANGVTWPNLLVTMAPYPVLVAILARRHRRQRVRCGLLAAVTVLYGLPFLVLGAEWSWLPWPVAAAVLCLLPGRVAWPLLGLILAGTWAGGLLQSDSALMASWRVNATATDALIIFSLYTLANMVHELHAARTELARLAAVRERLRLDGELRRVVGGSLRTIADRLRRAGRAEPEAARTHLGDAIEAARSTMAGIRATAGEYRTATPPATAIESPRLARLILLAVIVLQSAKVLVAVSIDTGGHPSLLILGVPLLSGMLVLQALLMRRPTRVRLALIALLIVPAALPGSYVELVLGHLSSVWGFLSGAVLAYVRPPRSWAIVALLLTMQVSLYFYPPPVPAASQIAADMISHVILAWLFYSLTRLADLVVLLDRARHDLAQTAIARERARIGRDLHDVLGFSLSAVALRGELVMRLLDDDPGRATAELAALGALAERAQTELGLIADGRIRLPLHREIDAVLEVLADAGVATETALDAGSFPAALDTALAAVLRESVTNILRHSRARTCTISLTRTADAVRLRIVNDGADPAPAAGGSGLAGLAERTGGRLRAGHRPGGRFEVVAEFRSDPAGLGGDADGVDAIAGAHLGHR